MRRIPLLLLAVLSMVTGASAQEVKPADAAWWSLRPLGDVAPPRLDGDSWSRSDIDRFVLARLRSKGLTPSPAAPPRPLVRRVYFDLIGLPPPPAVVKEFVRDPSDAAFRQLVDELLASHHYGERWGRHWLDVARFGESHGFERNAPRKNAWRYRDWVIDAWNNDLPYDDFARLQIAGDIENPGAEGAAAVGFLVAGLHNTVVGSSERMRLLARQDELAEIAGAVAQGFLGLTVHCARCHDHKFDPISSPEYYGFIAALDGIRHGERTMVSTAEQEQLDAAKARLHELEANIEAIDAPVRKAILAARKSNRREAKPATPRPVATWEFEGDLRDSVGNLHGSAFGSVKVEGGALVVDGGGHVRTAAIAGDISEKTLEAWVVLADLDQRGGGVMSLQALGGGVFDAIVYGEKEPGQWLVGSDSFRRTRALGGANETAARNRAVHIAIVYRKDGLITTYRNGEVYGTPYKTTLQTFATGKAEVAFGIRHSPAGGNRMLRGRILRASLHARALTPEGVRACADVENRFVSEAAIVAALDHSASRQRTALMKQASGARASMAAAAAGAKFKVFTVAPGEPGVMRIHHRGSVASLGDAIKPGGIAALQGVDSDFGLAKDASDAARRRALANWITHRDNPIFARVLVNRVWHHHFGLGIVDTPSDLGVNGGRPSHPDLLDWLARRFRDSGFRLKALHRLIVTSATYRQASRPAAAGIRQDADNRLLWRHSPRRLDAESLRDAILAVAGRLNVQPGGPGFVDVSITPIDGTTYYEPIDPIGAEFERRTIYRFAPRGGRSALLDAFDCPDPSSAAPKRSVTTTPLQALSLLNNSFVLRMGKALADRVAGERTIAARVRRIYELALARPPATDEAVLARRLVEQHGLRALARALLNSSEFVVIE